MQKAIYLKQVDEACFCQPNIPDGTKCTIHAMKGTDVFVKVNGYSKGRFGCLVYYKAKNFIMCSEHNEDAFHKEELVELDDIYYIK